MQCFIISFEPRETTFASVLTLRKRYDNIKVTNPNTTFTNLHTDDCLSGSKFICANAFHTTKIRGLNVAGMVRHSPGFIIRPHVNIGTQYKGEL